MALNPPGTASARWVNTPAPAVPELLQRLFRMAHSEWARDFLFFPNPTVDAGILTSPRHLQHKVSGQIRLDVKEDRIGPYNTDPYMDMTDLSTCSDDRLYADWVIVPAFNFGTQGACYFMNKQNIGPTQDRNGAVRSALYRIITDDVTGEVLYVGDIPETDTFQVVHMRHISGALHERAICFFEGSVFRQALVANDGNLSLAHLAKAMTFCIHTRETRMCIICGRHPAALCMCRVTLRQAKHPHDMHSYAFNARTHLGQYQGKEFVMYMKNGDYLFNRPQLTQHLTNDNASTAVEQHLRVWAVQDRLGNVLPRVAFFTEKDRLVAQAAQADENKSFGELIDDLLDVEKHVSGGVASSPINARSSEVDISHDLTSAPVQEHTVIHLSSEAFSNNSGTNSQSSELAAQLAATHLMPTRNREPQSPIPLITPAQRQQLMEQQQQMAMKVQYAAQKREAQQRLAQRIQHVQIMQQQEEQTQRVRAAFVRDAMTAASPAPMPATTNASAAPATMNTMRSTSFAHMHTDATRNASPHATTGSCIAPRVMRTPNGAYHPSDTIMQQQQPRDHGSPMHISSCSLDSPVSSSYESRPSLHLTNATAAYARFPPAAMPADPPLHAPPDAAGPKQLAPAGFGSPGVSGYVPPRGTASSSRLRARRRAGASSIAAVRPPVRERRLLPRGNQPARPATSTHDRELELRIRKREAARRSDQRRLARVQQLRDETMKLEMRAVELREREKQLQDENKQLREKVADLTRLER